MWISRRAMRLLQTENARLTGISMEQYETIEKLRADNAAGNERLRAAAAALNPAARVSVSVQRGEAVFAIAIPYSMPGFADQKGPGGMPDKVAEQLDRKIL